MKHIFMIILIALTSTYTHTAQVKPTNSYVITQKVLSVAVGVGAAVSFFLWAPVVLQVINKKGLCNAYLSTHIPRLMLDAGAVALSCMAYTSAQNYLTIEVK